MIVLKIAFRNMREHKTKTLIVGVLITLGAFIMVAGNSFMDSVTAGMKSSFSANYTGDVIVHGLSETEVSLMPGPESINGGAPVIADFSAVQERVDGLDGVAASLPLISGMASIGVDETSVGFSMLWGFSYERYREMFPDNLVLVAGEWPLDPAASVIMSEKVYLDAQKEAKRPIGIGEKLLLSSMGDKGTKIREVTLRAVFRFKQGGDMLDLISFTDPGTLRSLAGMSAVPATAYATMPADPDGASASIDEDTMFGSESLTSQAAPTDMAPLDFNAILGDTSVRNKYAQTDSDAWNFLLVRLDDASGVKGAMQSIERWAKENGIELAVSDWRWGAGVQADLAYYLQMVFNIVVVIIVLVAVIIIMNTLVISITERIPEIGTMRAMGAGKPFVRIMILSETLMVSVAFGLIGMALGSIAIMILNAIGMSSSNMLLSTLFGSSVFRPAVSLGALANAMAAVLAIGAGSCLYPIAIALKIPPIRAMQR